MNHFVLMKAPTGTAHIFSCGVVCDLIKVDVKSLCGKSDVGACVPIASLSGVAMCGTCSKKHWRIKDAWFRTAPIMRRPFETDADFARRVKG